MQQQNFKKNPHIARFLQTFHSGIGSNGVNYRAEAEERTATEFVSGGAQSEFHYYKGYKIRTGTNLVSERQADWIVDIAETREGVTDEMVKSLSIRLEQGFAKAAASAFIEKYKDLPKRVTVAQATAGHGEPSAFIPEVKTVSDVPAGRYAVERDGVLKFYRVSKGKGQWAGRTFLEIQASDDRHPIRNAKMREEILAQIAEAPEEAATRYGVELGSCYRCGRTLTDETSRALGIGPDCRNK
jgi:hypothetical protein